MKELASQLDSVVCGGATAAEADPISSFSQCPTSVSLNLD